MDAMQLDPTPDEARSNIVGGLIQAARAGRVAERRPPDFVMWAILPDWTFDLLTEADLQNLIALHNVRAVRRSEAYPEEESQ